VAKKKHLLMFLLVLGIGFAPLQAISAGIPGHMDSMPSGCTGCDMNGGVDPGACDGTDCAMAAGACGANSISSIAQEIPLSSMAPGSLDGYFFTGSSLFQSYLDFSIYRPPIT